MNWNGFVDSLFREYDFNEELNKIEIKFSDDKCRLEPSLFTRFNSYFIKSIEIYENNRIAFVYPNDSRFLASLLIYKEFYELYNGDTRSNEKQTYKIGDMLCLGKSVFRVCEVNETSVMFEFKKGKGIERNGRLLSKLPPLSKARPGAEIGSYNTFKEEYEKYISADQNAITGILMRSKNLRNNTIVVIGPVQKYVKLFRDCCVDSIPLLDFIQVGKMDKSGSIVPLNGNFDNFHIIICPDLDLASYLLENQDYPIESIFLDTCGKNNIDPYLASLDDILQHDIELVLFIPENSSFEYEQLKMRDFVFFQWKKAYLLNNLFDKDSLDQSLDTFRKRNISFIEMDDGGLSELYYEFLGYRKEVEDMPSIAINAYISFFSAIKDELPKYCYLVQDEDKIINKMFGLETHCRNLESVKKDIIGNHPLIASAKETYDFIFGYLAKNNRKIDYIWETITNIEDSEDKVAIIVSDNTNVDDVSRYYSKRMWENNHSKLYFDVINVSDFQFSKWHYKKAIFAGWFRKEIMKTALLSNNADENIILLYRCEIPWVKSAEKNWNDNSIVNDFTKINSEINDECFEPVFLFNDTTSDVSDDLDETSSEQSKLLINGLLKENRDTEFIEAIPLVFSNAAYAFFPANKTIVSATMLLSGDSDELESILVSSVKPGDILVIKDNSSSDILIEMSEKIIGNADVVSLSKLWKDSINQKMTLYDLDVQQMVIEIEKAGSKRHSSTIRSWIVNEAVISPRNIEDLKCIAVATGDDILLEEYKRVFEACSKVRASRISAGLAISKAILDSPEIKKALASYSSNGVLNIRNQSIDIKELGITASILKVIEVGEKQEFPKLLCNKRRNNY